MLFLWIFEKFSESLKNFQNFSLELKYHGKLKFSKLEFPISSRSLHISKTVLELQDIFKNSDIGHFGHLVAAK